VGKLITLYDFQEYDNQKADHEKCGAHPGRLNNHVSEVLLKSRGIQGNQKPGGFWHIPFTAPLESIMVLHVLLFHPDFLGLIGDQE